MVFILKNTETVDGGAYVDPIPDAWELEFIDVGQVSNTCGSVVCIPALTFIAQVGISAIIHARLLPDTCCDREGLNAGDNSPDDWTV